jgi:hypothetical protein
MGLFAEVSVAIDGSKFKGVNNRDKNFTRAKMQRRMAQVEESVARYLHRLDSAGRQDLRWPARPRQPASKRKSQS